MIASVAIKKYSPPPHEEEKEGWGVNIYPVKSPHFTQVLYLVMVVMFPKWQIQDQYVQQYHDLH